MKDNSNRILFFSFILLLSCLVFIVYSLNQNPPALSPENNSAPTERVSGIYPNPEITPGDTFAAVTKDQVCTPGYTKTVRDVSVSVKRLVYNRYGISYPQPSGAYEVDHFIPLALGGSNSLENLWPEPADPRPGYHEKDVVENYLHDQVCKGNISLLQAQADIRADWYKVYKSIPNNDIDYYRELFDLDKD